jgi:hypothetical protein
MFPWMAARLSTNPAARGTADSDPMMNLPGDNWTTRRILRTKRKSSSPGAKYKYKSGSDPVPLEVFTSFPENDRTIKNPVHRTVNGVMSFVLLMVATPWLEFLFIFFTLQHGYNRSKILIQEGRKFFSPAVAKENEGPKGCIRLHTRYRATDCQANGIKGLHAPEGSVGLLHQEEERPVAIDRNGKSEHRRTERRDQNRPPMIRSFQAPGNLGVCQGLQNFLVRHC